MAKISGRERAEASSDIALLERQMGTMLRSRPRGRVSQAGGRPGLRALAGEQDFRGVARSQGRSINDVSRDFARGVRATIAGLNTARQRREFYNRSIQAPEARAAFTREMVNIGRRQGR